MNTKALFDRLADAQYALNNASAAHDVARKRVDEASARHFAAQEEYDEALKAIRAAAAADAPRVKLPA